MQISLSKKNQYCHSSVTVVMRFLRNVPIAISLLFLIYLWISFSTIISVPSPMIDNTNIEIAKVKREESVIALVRNDSDPSVGDSVENGGKTNATLAAKELERLMHLLRVWTSNKRREGCQGTGIYVYDLPAKFNKDLVDHCVDLAPWMDCEDLSNAGLGEPLSRLGKTWFLSHQYTLELVFHSRLLKHPCRVHNESEAKLFYVPFYGGLDITRWLFKNVSNDVKDSLGLELIAWLQSQWTWKRNSGKDHVLMLGKVSWDFRRKNSWGITSLLELEEMQNPTKIIVERKTWDVNEIGVPYPTYFHPHSDEDILSWQAKIISSDRGSIVGFAGAARPNFPDNIRSILIEQCTSVEDYNCKFLNCSEKGCSHPQPVIELFVGSEFCLQPPGDSPTRRSVFDSLVSGCIPVLFDPDTAYYQYPWHLPEDHDKYSVFIEQEKVRQREVNVIERLMKVSQKEKDDMRRFIVYDLLPGLVYSDTDSQLEQFQDAFSITINSLLERSNSLGSS